MLIAAAAAGLLCAAFKLVQTRKRCALTHITFQVSTNHQSVTVKLLPLSCTDTEDVLAADNHLACSPLIGLDCEWQPEQTGRDHSSVSLLQLCPAPGGSCVYLAQLLHMDGVPFQLRSLLENPLVVKVCVEGGAVPHMRAVQSRLTRHLWICCLSWGCHRLRRLVSASVKMSDGCSRTTTYPCGICSRPG